MHNKRTQFLIKYSSSIHEMVRQAAIQDGELINEFLLEAVKQHILRPRKPGSAVKMTVDPKQVEKLFALEAELPKSSNRPKGERRLLDAAQKLIDSTPAPEVDNPAARFLREAYPDGEPVFAAKGGGK